MSISPLKMLAVAAGAILIGASTVPAHAYKGETWILPIAFTQGSGFTTLAGAGYNGSNAVDFQGPDGVARVYWTMTDPSFDAAPQMYSVSAYIPSAGGTDWQPIESQFEGSAGEIYPIDPNIPWAGQFGTNHQYLGSNSGTAGTWVAAGPGPQAPADATYTAAGNGTAMWLEKGSYLYAKYDYGWGIHRSWSAIQLTQVTGVVPEPGSFLSLGVGLLSMGGLVLRRRSA